MNRSLSLVTTGFVAVAVAAIGLGAAPAAVDMCSSMMSNASLRGLPNTTITSAATVSGTFTPPGGEGAQPIQALPSFCRVTATLKPSPVSDVKIEVWMPTESWNGKLQGVGNGGLAGTITYGALAPAIKSGYASVSTDTGHVASDTTWLPNLEKEKDYGYRAIHGMTVAAKAIVQSFYGKAAKRSYFNGCSTGGGQAFGEVQLYPDDYDGVVAGAPQDFPTHLRAADIWEFQALTNDPANHLPKATLALVTSAVLSQCGGKEGAADGFLSSDPRTCRFDPEQLLCKEGQDAATCLTPPQVKAVQTIYAGYVDARTKRQIWPGELRGTEAPMGPGAVGWQISGMNGPMPFAGAAQFYSIGVLEQPDADYHTMDVDSAVGIAEKKFPFIDHTSTDLEAFTRRGKKLLIYHGLSDPLISPLNTLDYYGSVVETVQTKRHLDESAALAETQKSVRVFLVPGMGHCGGGPGVASFDAVSALDQWVEYGTAPEKIVASHMTNGAPEFSRPLCPYPKEAEYSGSGDRAAASNWVCTERPFIYDQTFYKGNKTGGNDRDKTSRNGTGSTRGE
jgi:feruloyl esterase